MADTVGNVPLIAGIPMVAGVAAASQPTIELAQQPPAALLLATTLAAVVLGRGGNGALLLRTDYGTLALKTSLSLPPGSRVDLKMLPGPPPAVMLLHVEEPATPAIAAGTPSPPGPAAPPAKAPATTGGGSAASLPVEAPPAQLDIGTEVEASVVAPPRADQKAALPVGTQLILRVALAPASGMTPPQAAATDATFAGTIVAGAADKPDQTLVETPLGTLALDRRLALPAGTALALERLAASSPGASPAELDMGMVVAARLVAPPASDPAAALPLGTRFMLRIAAMPTTATNASSGTMAGTGTVLPDGGSETLIETPFGTVALEQRLTLPPGTLVRLQRLSATRPDAPAPAPLAQRATWPALEQALALFERTAPDLAARLRSDLTPSSGQRLAGTLLFLMGALTNGSWPGARSATVLDASGNHELRLQLDRDVAELRRLADPPSGDWHVYVLPMLDGGAVRPVRLYLRRRSGSAGDAEQGARFVLDVDMSRLGPMQLDGLVRQRRFDLVLRSHRAITAEMRQDIAALFHDATSAAGLAGDVIFTTASRFAVAPLDALRAHIGIDA
jgi:hypothetical protein